MKRFEQIRRCYVRVIGGAMAAMTCLVCSTALADDADQLGDLKTELATNFGTGSTAIELVYLAEIVGAAIAYSRTKNPLVLGGIVVMSLFLNFALKHWGIQS